MPYLRGNLFKGTDDIGDYNWMNMSATVIVPDYVESDDVPANKRARISNGNEDLELSSGGELKSPEEADYIMNGAESSSSSRQPSPPDSRPGTPRVTIAPCPVRLTPFIPPINYGTVEKGTIFRSGFPTNETVIFLECLGLRSILTLVDETKSAFSKEMLQFMAMYDIKHATMPVIPNKPKYGKSTSLDSICQAILFVMNPTHHPVHIHCNQGKHRTGCVVACLRKIQQWPIDEIIFEYLTYAGGSFREADIDFIKSFDPACVYDYAKEHDLLDSWPSEKRKDSATCIWDLASALPAHERTQIPDEDEDDDEDYSDEDEDEDEMEVEGQNLAMSQFIDPQLLGNGAGMVRTPSRETAMPHTSTLMNGNFASPDVTVTEVDDDDPDVQMSGQETNGGDSYHQNAPASTEPVPVRAVRVSSAA